MTDRKREAAAKADPTVDADLRALSAMVRGLRNDVDAMRAAIATVAPDAGRLAEALRRAPRNTWSTLCRAVRAQRGG